MGAIEVGLGGRLDATNVVAPDATVITNIGLDHTHILGDTHAKIAAEKAGIIKRRVPCVTATDNPSALDVIRNIAAERDAPLLRAGPHRVADCCDVTWTEHGDVFTIRTPKWQYPDLRCGLAGEHQRANAACAVAALEMLAEAQGFVISEDRVAAGLATVRLPGRFEIIGTRPTVILDGAHNAMAADALAAEIRKLPRDRLIVVVGMVQGHEPEGVLAPLAPLASWVIATEPNWVKRQPAEKIAEIARRLGCSATVVTPPVRALEAAREAARPDDVVLVTGSFYTVGDTKQKEQ